MLQQIIVASTFIIAVGHIKINDLYRLNVGSTHQEVGKTISALVVVNRF